MLRFSGRPRHPGLQSTDVGPSPVLHRLNDMVGYGNLASPLDLIIVQGLTFLGMSLLGIVVLMVSGAPFDEEAKRTACLLLPAATAPLPGLLVNNLHRFKMVMDHLILTGDILSSQPQLSVPAAWRLGTQLMGRIKRSVGYNRRPACRYMRAEYPYLLGKVTERVRTCSIPVRDETVI